MGLAFPLIEVVALWIGIVLILGGSIFRALRGPSRLTKLVFYLGCLLVGSSLALSSPQITAESSLAATPDASQALGTSTSLPVIPPKLSDDEEREIASYISAGHADPMPWISGPLPTLADVEGVIFDAQASGRPTTPYLAYMQAKENAALAGNAAVLEASRMASQPGYAEREIARSLQQGFFSNIADSWHTSKIFKFMSYISDEQRAIKRNLDKSGQSGAAWELYCWLAAASGKTIYDESYDKQAHSVELLTAVSVLYWPDIMGYDSLEQAQMARSRILASTEREERLAAQWSSTSKLALLVGRLPDFLTGLLLLSITIWIATKAVRRHSARNSLPAV